MQCDFLDWNGGIFGGYYCSKKKDYVDSSTRNRYCDNSLAYRNCPIYTQRDTGCYLTTCMCYILGYKDHCKTLDRLRNFRDSYMKNEEELQPLLEDYDTVGPLICEKMLEDDNKTRTAHIMLAEYITPAITCIENNEYETAIEIYKTMTTDLMDHYQLDKSLLSQEKLTINKQRKMKLQLFSRLLSQLKLLD